LRQRILAWAKRRLLRRVDLMLLHQKDTAGMRECYGIDPARMRYIPYKVNSLRSVERMDIPEGEYVFSGGRSRRDYTTFCAAMAGLELPTLLLTPPDRENAFHETFLDRANAPTHVHVVHDDGSPESWLEAMARARIVVIPVLPNSISPSGVGTYLLAMALGKCVIMTESPATRDVLEHEKHAILVPMANAEALREAVRRAWHDDAYRRRIAATGQAYALSLGGVENLQRNIAQMVLGFLQSQGAAG
ncbi:MAG: glycosyltransferase, partial [Candidatus Acidiferrum sp.]